MKIALYTNDLTEQNAHLMPWRTIIEVASGMRAEGHDAVVLSGRPEGHGRAWQCGAVSVIDTEKLKNPNGTKLLHRRITSGRFEALYWPFAWWRASAPIELLSTLSIPVVGYLPGARYDFSAVLRALPSLGLRASLPYLVQSIYPSSALVRGMRASGVRQVITMSEFSRKSAIAGGWPANQAHAIWPGREAVMPQSEPTPVFSALKTQLDDAPFFLFLGPPTPIRGTNQLLDAFESLSKQHPSVRLVCLFRADSNIDIAATRRVFEQSRQNDRLHVIWGSLTCAELAAFLKACYAVALPFLLVPSEIPLAIIEAAGHGKPVISTGPSGTGDFVSTFGIQTRVADADDLSAAMHHLLDDPVYYSQCCMAAFRTFDACKTWPDVARNWLDVLKNLG